MSKSYKEIIEDLENAILDIESKGISIAPLNKALENLKTHSENIQAIENNIDAVKSEVIDPIKTELEENKRAGKFSVWGFYVGAFGLIVTAISLLYTTFGTNSKNLNNTTSLPADSVKNMSISENLINIENSVKELNYSILGLNDDYKPLINELIIGQLEQKLLMSHDSSKLIIKAYILPEVEKDKKWYPVVSLSFSIDDKKLGIKGLEEKVSIIDNSGIAKYDPNFNSIILSENDGFIIFGKYKFSVRRIYRTSSQTLNVCDAKEAVLLKRIE